MHGLEAQLHLAAPFGRCGWLYLKCP